MAEVIIKLSILYGWIGIGAIALSWKPLPALYRTEQRTERMLVYTVIFLFWPVPLVWHSPAIATKIMVKIAGSLIALSRWARWRWQIHFPKKIRPKAPEPGGPYRSRVCSECGRPR